MREMVRVATVQMQVRSLDVAANLTKMRAMLNSIAADGKVDLVVFPELADIGYIRGPGEKDFVDFSKAYLEASQSIPGPFTDALGEMARKHGSHIVCGMSETHPTIPATICNSAVLIEPTGKVASVYRKTHIPPPEKHYFCAGNSIDVVSTELGKIGIIICVDNSNPEPARVLSLKGAEIICVPYCKPKGLAVDPTSLCQVASCRAFENSNFLITSHQVGGEGNQAYEGLSCICGPYGEFLARSELKTAEDILRATLYREELHTDRMTFARFRERRPDVYEVLTQPTC